VTPNRYVSAIITERGVARAPYVDSLKALADGPTAEVSTPRPQVHSERPK